MLLSAVIKYKQPMKNPTPNPHRNLFSHLAKLKRHKIFVLALSLAALPSISSASSWTGGAADNNWDNLSNWDSDPSGGVGEVDTLTAYPIITANNTLVPNDLKIAAVNGAPTGQVDIRSGILTINYWGFVGDWDGNATLNIADTTTSGGTFTGYGQGTGGFDCNNNGNGNFMVGLYNSTGVVNMNTTGSFDATEVRLNPNSPSGSSGSGTFNLDAGAVNVAGSFQVGSDFWGAQVSGGAYLNMSGGSITVGSEVWTGGSGPGTTVQTGGAITNGTWFVIGRNNGSVGTYYLNGGTITKLASGTSATIIGSSAGSQGTLNVNGGSLYSAGSISVGEGGAGTLNLTNGTVTADNTSLVIGMNSGSSGTVNLVGGTLSVGSISNNAGSGTFNFNGGTLKPMGNNATFMPSLTAANVENGGANIDTAGYDVTIAKGLQGAGSLTKLGLGTLTLSGVSTYTGNTVISNGTLALSGTATLASRVIIPSGKTLDVTALSVGIQNPISGVGSVNGNATGASGMMAIPATNGTVGTLTFNNNLDMSVGGGATLDLSTSGTSGNDQVVVTGNLTLSSSDTIQISALSGAANLDVVNDYVLFAVSGTLTMATTPALQFVGTPPANSGSYLITASGNNVVLHHIAATAPAVVASASPSTVVRNQSTTITATVTPGSGSIASVTVNLTSIGGSSSAVLYLSGTPNVYTNTFAVGGSVSIGSKSLSVVVTDNTSPTPLTGSTTVSLNVVVRNEVWTGVGNGNWSDNADWTTAAPGISGDAVTFAGTTGLTPNMDNSYSVTSLTFNNTAGSFTVGSGNSSTLTLNGNLTNDSTGTQTLAVPVVTFTGNTIISAGTLAIGGAAQWGGGTYGGAISVASGAAFDHASSANQTNAGTISGAGDLKKSGSGILVMNTRNSSFTGSVKLGAGTLSANPGNQATDGTFSYVSDITVSNGATLRTSANGLFGWDGSQAKPINVQSGGVALNFGGDVNVGIINLAGGTLASTNEDTYWGSWSFGRGTDKNLHATENSTVTANYVGFHNGATIEVDAGKTLNYQGFIVTTAADGGNTVNKIGDGTLVLSGENTYAGGTTINAGILQIGNGGTNGSITGDVVNNANLVINRSSGTLSLGVVSGGGSITNQGGGNLTAAQFYASGPVTLNSSTLSLDASTAFFNGGLTVNNGGGLTLADNGGANSVSATDVTFSGTNTLTINYGTLSSTPAQALSLSGSLTSGTKTTINISGIGLTNGMTVPLIYAAAGVANTNGFVLGSLPSGIKGVLTNATSSTLDFLVTSAGQNLAWRGTYDGVISSIDWNVNFYANTNWFDSVSSPAAYQEYSGNTIGDNVSFGDTAFNTDGTNHVNLTATVHPASLVVNSGVPYTITGSGSIGGSSALLKSGSGSLFLGTANTYSGGTTVNSGGTLIITNDNALGAGSTGVTLAGGTLQFDGAVTSARAITVTANATLSASTNTSSTLNGNVSGTVGLTMTGNGALTLAGSNSIGGAITVNAATANVTGSLTGGSTLTQSGTGNLTISGPYSSVGDAAVNNGGAISLAGSGSLKAPRLFVATGGATGTVNISGTSLLTNNFSGGGSWWIDYALGLGVDSNHEGTLNMSGGTVKETGSVWIGAWGGTGHWNQTGGTANINGNFWVGGMQDNNTSQPNGSIGTAIISNATLTAGNVIVGTGGAGSGSNPTSVAASRNKGDMTVANGGVVTSTNDMQVGRSGQGSNAGGWGSYGKLNIENGGIVNVATTVTKWMTVGRYNSADATVNVKPGGTLNLNAGTDLMVNEGNNTGIRVVTVEGLLQGTAAGGSYIDLNRNGTAGGTTTFNITNGGVVAVDSIIGKANCTLNFDNGTLKATASDASFIGTLINVNINAGGATLDSNGKNPTVPGKLIGSGSLTKIGNGTLFLNATNTYTGVTTVNGGGLGGTGTIAGALTNNATLAPGSGNVGVLTVNGNITLNAGSTNTFLVNGTTLVASNRVVAGAGVQYGGVLNVVTNGTFSAGQQFQLFSGAGATNASNFSIIVGSPGSGLAFSFTNGVLSVLSVGPSGPGYITNSVSGNTLTLSWPAGQGWILQMQTNSLTTGLGTNWVDVPGSSGISSTNITLNPAQPTAFYRLKY